MVTSPLIVRHHTRRNIPHPTSTLWRHLPAPLSSNSFPLNLFADPHPLNPAGSIFYKNLRGGGGIMITTHPSPQCIGRVRRRAGYFWELLRESASYFTVQSGDGGTSHCAGY